MKNLIILVLFVFNPAFLMADELAPFTTDGCSSFPDGTVMQQSLWLDCCVRHDWSYWKGGSYEDRQEADISLKNCVTKTGESEIAKLMLAGVRVGGSPYLPTPFRWGYGWSYFRGYQALSEQELDRVSNKLDMFMQIITRIAQQVEIQN